MSVEKSCYNCRFNDYICPNDYENIQENDFKDIMLLDFALNSVVNCERCFCQGEAISDGICRNGDAENCPNYEEKP